MKTLQRVSGWPTLTLLIAGSVTVPVAVVGWAILSPSWAVWEHLWQTRFIPMLLNTLKLMAGVGIGSLVLGTGLAWLVTLYRFPGRRALEWMLILPLAMPGYVLAFVVLSILNYTGPIQTALRSLFGADVWFPDVRSAAGVIAVLTLSFYPYVYLLARAAFLEQGARLIEAARSLGHSKASAFFRVILPMARSSLAAGTALVLMETIADIGAVNALGYETLTIGVYRVWIGLGEKKAALELAAVLLLFAISLLMLERGLRGRARYFQAGGRSLGIEPTRLKGWRGWGAAGLCLAVVALAFGIPFTQLVFWSVGELSAVGFDPRYIGFAANTLLLASVTAAIAVFLALLLAYGGRLHRRARWSIEVAATGYAIPGAVIGLGILASISFVQDFVNRALIAFGWPGNVILFGSLAVLIYAYVVRFMAVAYRPVEASLGKITPSMDMAARSLRASPTRTLRQVHAPLMGVGILTGSVLVFVDVMKELPATLLLRPIGYDTLATRIWQLTSESLWEAAALPALTIVLAGAAPVAILIRQSRRLRSGESTTATASKT